MNKLWSDSLRIKLCDQKKELMRQYHAPGDCFNPYIDLSQRQVIGGRYDD